MEIATEPQRKDHERPVGWTLSIATVGSDVRFSTFPGFDRHLMALSEGTLGLVVDGAQLALRRWEVAAFDGDSDVQSVGVDRPTLDLNLMVARERFRGLLRTETISGTVTVRVLPNSTVVVVMLAGSLSLRDADEEDRALQVHEAVRSGADPLVLSGDGTVAVAQVQCHRPR